MLNLVVVALSLMHVAVYPQIICAELVHVEQLQAGIDLAEVCQIVQHLHLLTRASVTLPKDLLIGGIAEFCVAVKHVWTSEVV